LKNINFLKN